MDNKMFDLWAQNREKGKSKFVLSYGFTATLIGLLVLLVVKMLVWVSNFAIIAIMVGVGVIGVLFGLIVWNTYEKQYLARLEEGKKQD